MQPRRKPQLHRRAPTWRRLGPWWVWTCMPRRWSRRSWMRRRVSCASSGWAATASRASARARGCRVPGRGAGQDPARGDREGQDRPTRRRAPGPPAFRRQAPPGQGSGAGRGGTARPGPCPRGPPRRSDARPPRALEAPAAPRHPLRRPGLDRAPPRLAWEAGASRRCRAGDADRLPGRRRGAPASQRELERQLAAAVPAVPWADEIGRLRCLRGVDTLTAVGLCAEIGDFARFARAGQLMSYLGLVPAEHSSGAQRRLGSITRSGSRHARRLLVEAAWHYRNQPRVGVELERRQQGQPQAAVAIAWSAQRRLHRVWWRMQRRGKRSTLITVAVARELAGFCWSIARVE